MPALGDLALPLLTLLGLAERPGEAHGLGALDPALARDLTAAGARHPASTFCITITDENGYAIGHGCCTPMRGKKGRAIPIDPDRVTITPSARAGPDGGYGSWILTLPGAPLPFIAGIDPVPTYDCDHRHEIPRLPAQRQAPPPHPGPRRQVLLPRLLTPRPRLRLRARPAPRQGRPHLRLQRPLRQPLLPPRQAGPRLARHQATTRLDPMDHQSRPHLPARTLALPLLNTRPTGRTLAEGEGGDGASLAWRGARSARAGTGHQDDFRGGHLDGQAGTDRLGGGMQGLLLASMADGQVRDHLGVLPAIGWAGRKRGEGRAGQDAERRGITRAEPDDFPPPPNQPIRSSVNSNDANPANSLRSVASSGSLIPAGGRNGYSTVMCAGTPSLAAASSWARWRLTAGSAAGTGSSSAVSQPGRASGIKPGMPARLRFPPGGAPEIPGPVRRRGTGPVRRRGNCGIVMPGRGEEGRQRCGTAGGDCSRDTRRTRAWPVLATCVIVIAALGLRLRGQAQPDGFDSAVDTAMVASFSSHQGVLPWLALPGSTIPLIAVSAAIAIGCLIAGRSNGAVLAVAAVPVTAFLDDMVLKHLVDRTHSGQLSFPSGHTASAMTLATVLGVLLHDPARRTATRMARAALVVVACAVTVLVGVGVIGLRWHYFTDTVGGVALGTGTVLTLAFLIDLVPGVVRRRRSGAAPGADAG